jgi:bifunctional UDP-N-acetylglucosamine pyrophosphorylase/glucosamine-1-phosphate N-acetyltransferase
MLPIAGKPILEHLLIEAKQAGIVEFVFVVGYGDEPVRDYFGGGGKWKVSISYANQRKQLGTADALKTVESLVDGNFLVMSGDVIVDRKDIRRLAGKTENTLSVIEVSDTDGLGIVELGKGKVLGIYEKTEKPPSRIANAGLYLFTPEIFQAISLTPRSPRGEYEITDSLGLMIDRGQRIAYQQIGRWLDLSYPWDLLPANERLLGGIKAQNLGEVEENVVIKGTVAVGKGTVLRSGAYIVGPVIIGQDCDIGPNCYLRSFTSIGDGCHIGNAVEVKNCIIMRGAKLPHHNYVGDSVIGEECNFGAGTKVANLRLDKQEVRVADIDTGRRKLGAIIGDRVETGINASLNVGSIIGSGTFIGPGALVNGVILPGSRVF